MAKIVKSQQCIEVYPTHIITHIKRSLVKNGGFPQCISLFKHHHSSIHETTSSGV